MQRTVTPLFLFRGSFLAVELLWLIQIAADQMHGKLRRPRAKGT
jgi:hypothetical protein